MNINWFSGRRIGVDLASSTEIGLCRELERAGNNVHLISPGMKNSEGITKHTVVEQSRFPGLQTISLGRKIKKLILEENEYITRADVCIVDWRLVPSLWKCLKKMGATWFIIDRGPPVYSGFLTELQKIQWKKAWKLANEHANAGFVVSRKHEEFVRKRVETELQIIDLPAGIDISHFESGSKIPGDELVLIYSGRIDSNRGISQMLKLRDYSEKIGKGISIRIMGEGNEVEEIRRVSEIDKSVVFLGKLGRKDVVKELEKSHVGILPMPETPVWRTSSPLKLVEYIAAGLLVIGPKHSGNSTTGDHNWELLSEDDEWVEECCDMINSVLSRNKWGDYSMEARGFAKSHEWSKIAKKMEEAIINSLGS